MKPASGSLVARLSWQMIALQLLVLTAVAVVFALPIKEHLEGVELDDDVLAIVASNLTLADGRLDVGRDEDLAALMADHPRFWFVVRDGEGRSLRYGPVPPRVSQFLDGFKAVVYAEIRTDGSDPDLDVLMRVRDGPAGPVIVATGGGPEVTGFLDRFKELNKYYLGLLALMATLTLVGTPILLRKEFRGVTRVAEEAEHIDIDQPGTRLTEANVPEEIRGMVQAMNAALLRLDQGLEKRHRFLATAAHELRTPIAILTTRIELLAAGDDRTRLLLDVARLGTLADQLLDLQRLDNDGQLRTPLDLCALASEVARDIAPLVVTAGAEIALDVPPWPVMVAADRQAISRVLTNLIQNAIAHGGPGVAIEVEVTPNAEVRIRDNGPGVPPADRERIFEPFHRGSTDRGGAGLGLNLVQEIVTRHHGSVHVTDAAKGGAEFVVRLPSGVKDAPLG
ncbi:sensor histidine kinase [Pleomorphomonas diazotrophica]|uniref:histidine kinase n=1 Tax=Pleomorphomonas diazotrophica TaxID=1166257 RepID=A0A1I4UVU8_9HYPH|nr:HAMP domain-containing sensor histidine kinase [Pleomorphomonas diazotrophica]PKR89790.1 sensor histidine kinase [Pleomorphomonas diazotrophica]SFM92873.1 Signal transduction histidine kinase [Pleomorphomonas diazotrophica]